MTPSSGNEASGPSGRLDVGVVVITYNSGAYLDGLIASLPEGMRGLRWDLVAVDNCSHDDTVDRLKDAGLTVHVMDRNAGYSAAINVGIEHFATARSILVLNPDIQLTAGAIATLFSTLDDPAVGIAVPQVRDFAGDLSLSLRRSPTLKRSLTAAAFGGTFTQRLGRLSEFVADTQVYLRPSDVDWAMGGVMLLAQPCVAAVGMWDTSFFLYSEETDYCERVRRAGFAIRYVPESVVRHEGGIGAFDERLRSMMTVNRVRHYARHHDKVRAWMYFVAVLVFDGSRAVFGDRASRASALALLFPHRRPPEIGASESVLPR